MRLERYSDVLHHTMLWVMKQLNASRERLSLWGSRSEGACGSVRGLLRPALKPRHHYNCVLIMRALWFDANLKTNGAPLYVARHSKVEEFTISQGPTRGWRLASASQLSAERGHRPEPQSLAWITRDIMLISMHECMIEQAFRKSTDYLPFRCH